MGGMEAMIASTAFGQLMQKTPIGTMAESIPGVGGMLSGLGETAAKGMYTEGWNEAVPHPLNQVMGQIPGMQGSPAQVAQQKAEEEHEKLKQRLEEAEAELKAIYDLNKPEDYEDYGSLM